MTKELTPLKAFERVKDHFIIKGWDDEKHLDFIAGYLCEKELNVIETALKRLEELEKPAFILTKEPTQEEMNSILERLNTPSAITIDYENEKKLKALEIIKEIVGVAEEDFQYDTRTDKYYVWGFETTKEKFDLLKEVLK